MLLIGLLTRHLGKERGDWRLPRTPDDCPAEVVDLIDACLNPNPAARPTAAQVLERLRAAAAADGCGD